METITDKKFTDQELYLLIQQKNEAAFVHLYDRYGCTIYGLALKAVQSKEFADEVVEQTFLNVWNSIHQFRSQKKTFFTWLVCVFIKTAKDYLDSKSIKFTVKTDNFPEFSFNIIEEKVC